MTRTEQLRFCKVCKHQQFNLQQGIICGLTQQPADFETQCANFEDDPARAAKVSPATTDNLAGIEVASMGTRFLNYVLDTAFTFLLGLALGAVLGVLLAIWYPSGLSVFEQDNKVVEYLFGFVLGMFYYTVLEYSTGKTFAKMITNTRVVNEYGLKPDLGTIIVRSLCRFIPFDAISYLATEGIGWHDSLSKTRVIKETNQPKLY